MEGIVYIEQRIAASVRSTIREKMHKKRTMDRLRRLGDSRNLLWIEETNSALSSLRETLVSQTASFRCDRRMLTISRRKYWSPGSI